MKNAFWAYWLILLGVFVVVIMLLVQSVTTNNQQDYYLIKELTEAAMVDAVDYGYYRQYGEIKINKEKLIESFIRRFAENASLTSEYTVNFYDIYEAPPKASIEVKGKSSSFTIVGDSTDFDIVNRIDAILEGNTLDPNVDYSVKDEAVQSQAPVANQLITTSKTTSSISVNLIATKGTNDIIWYYFSKDNGLTWIRSSSNSYSFSNLSDNATYNLSGYVKDSRGVNSNTVSLTETTSVRPVTQPSTPSAPSTPSTPTTPTSCIPDSSNIVNTTPYSQRMIRATTITNSLDVYDKMNSVSKITSISGGSIFEVIGENSNGTKLAIKYCGADQCGTDLCGWVNSDKVAVNLEDFIPELEFNITNKTKSMFRTKGEDINNLTGVKLYTNDYQPIAMLSFAKQLQIAVSNATRAGKTLVVYDAYRPRGVTRYAYNTAYYNDKVQNNTSAWDLGWFLSSGPSAHNTACAVDITIKGGSMPTAMHDISMNAVKYASAYSKASWSSGMKNSPDAQNLNTYMMTNTGLEDLNSEWWHYQDDECHARVKGYTSGQGAYFWSTK